MDYLHYFYLLFVVANYSFLESCASVSYVKPHDQVTCPNVTGPCLTLREYAEKPKQCFTSNSSLIFLPGTHELDTSIYFVNVSNFSLFTYVFERNDMTRVIISSSGNIEWTNCSNVIVFGMMFIMNGDSITKRSSGLALIKTNGLLSNLTLRHTHRVGAIFVHSSDVVINDLTVRGTGSISGNAFHICNSTVDFSGENVFYDCRNVALNPGGTMILYDSTITFSGENVFLSNSVSCTLFGAATTGGGALFSIFSTLIFSGSVSFYNNTVAVDYCAAAGGGAILASDSTIVFNSLSDVVFNANAAQMGGAICIYNSSLRIEENATAMFLFNAASLGGGAICSQQSEIWSNGKTVIFQKNCATSVGGAILTESSIAKLVNVTFEENETGYIGGAFCKGDGLYLHISSCEFFNNTAAFAGGAVGVLRTRETVFGGGNSFKYNSAREAGGAIVVMFSDVTFSGANNFINNSAPLFGGSIHVFFSNSSVNMTGNQTFIGNFADEGGAIAFIGRSKLLLTEPIQVNFIQNHADTNGGAIFYKDHLDSIRGCDTTATELERAIDSFKFIQLSKQDCFIEVNVINTSSLFLSRIQFHFVNNTAGSAGSVLYGGGLDQCKISIGDGATDICGNRIEMVNFADALELIKNNISSIVSDDKETSHISSDPRQVCICAHNDLVCNYTHKEEIQTVRGKEFTVNAVAIGLDGGTVPSNILISSSNDFQVGVNQSKQWAGKKCTPITYQLFSEKNTTTLVLFPEGPCRDSGQSRREIIVNFLPCPEGFSLEGSSCVCEERLQQYTTECSVNDNSIRRQENTFWMGVSYENESYEGLILHSGCPFDYCTHEPVSITLDNMDIQCNHNHTGMLCGACKSNYSIALGTLHCLPCSNHYLALVLPFAVAGIVLIAVLLLLKLSVADGTLNGIIFYANVVQANRSVFFLPGKTDILTVFIAWLNLDLGIETCFYDGMTAYAFTWLQFVFPFYIWLLMALIIVMSRFSDKIAKLFGTNPVTALATLFLLSYSKILRTVITALSTTSLEYPGDVRRKVWLYDGHVPYFQRLDHILLGTFTITVLLLLFLPYTILLLFGPCFQAYSHLRIFSWINRIKPFMDAYYAPYKKHTQYWTGLLLLLRCIMFLVFGLNTFANANFNLLIITSATAGLTAVAWIHKQLYEKQLNDVLEACSIINLYIFSALTYHARMTGGDQARLAYASVSITFITFICIVIQKVYLVIHKRFKLPGLSDLRNYVNKVMRSDRETDTNEEISMDQIRNEQSFKLPTLSTVVELREPLLDHDQ